MLLSGHTLKKLQKYLSKEVLLALIRGQDLPKWESEINLGESQVESQKNVESFALGTIAKEGKEQSLTKQSGYKITSNSKNKRNKYDSNISIVASNKNLKPKSSD